MKLYIIDGENMIKKLLVYIKGWIIISVSNGNYERFLNICNHNDIRLQEVIYSQNSLELKIDVKDFKKLKAIVKKTKVHIKIKERYGLPFFLFKNRKRKLFLAGILSALLLVKIMSLYIWQISFDGNYTHTEDELIGFLSEKGIKNGIQKKMCDSDIIEKELRNEYNDIKWASVEIIGTRLIVHIKENFNEIEEIEENQNYSLVAEKDAKIISIVTRKGTPLVKALDEVKKGDVLIGGYYDIMSDFQELISTEYVQADGTILAETVYNINETIDRNYTEKVYTGETYNEYSFKILNTNINIDWFNKKYKMSDSVEDSKQMVIADNFFLPMYYIKKTEREYNIETRYYSDEEAYSVGQENINIFLEKLIEKGIKITQNNVIIEVDENSIIISGEVICQEYIGEKRLD